MFQKIVVALSELPESKRALLAAIEMAANMHASLSTISVLGRLPAYAAYASVTDPQAPQELVEGRRLMHQAIHDEAKALAGQRGISAESVIIAGHEVKTIVDFLREHGADLLVVGLHQHDFYIARLWSTIYDLALEAPCSVLGVH